ncbi:MAG TPA: hypothetical protein VGM81_09655 [Burkholderiaceae bacterium]
MLERVRRALDVAAQALDQLELAEGIELSEELAPALIKSKLVAETTMLLRCSAFLTESDAEIARMHDVLARRLVAHARGEHLLAMLCQDPGSALDHAAAHIHLQALDHVDAGVEMLLQDVLADGELASPERPPHHELEHHWLRQIASGAVAGSLCDAGLLSRCCVARPLDALGSTTQDLYAFTHVVLHATDMGRRAALFPRPLQAIEADAEAALAAALDAGNFDLSAELLWTWPMLGRPWSAPAILAFHVLTREQDAHGFLPGPGYRAQAAHQLSEPQRQAYQLQTSYHASFVMGFLCAAALRPGRAPMASPLSALHNSGPRPGETRRGSAPSSVETPALLSLLAPRPEAIAWRAAMAELDAGQQATLADFVLAVVLRRAAASRDPDLLRAGLSSAVELNLADGPSVRQALAWLRRTILLARVIRTTDAGPSAIGSAMKPPGIADHGQPTAVPASFA